MQWRSSLKFFLEPEPSFLALLIFFGARAELFGSDYFFLEPEPNFLALLIFFGARAELFGSDYFFWSQSRAFWLWFFFGARAELFGSGYFFWSQSRAFGSEFLFWSLSWSLKFWEPTRALVGSLKFLLVSQDPFMDLVIPDFSPLVPQETILISHHSGEKPYPWIHCTAQWA